MNLEEKVQKKEKRKNSFKKLRIPIIIVAILLVMVLVVGYFLVVKLKTEETGSEATVEEEKIVVDENQTVGKKIGENKILYRDYIYTYTTDFKIEITRQKANGEESAQNVLSYQLQGSSQGDVYIYKDKIYFEADGRLKSFSIDGSGEEEVLKDLRISEPKFDFNKELIYFTYYEDRNDYDNGIGIAKFTTGEVIKKISTKNEKGSVNIINSDDTNVYYSVNEDTYDGSYSEEVEVTLYSLNKETFETKKIKTETISSGWSSSGIYDVKTNGDYLYYTVGSQQGTLLVFSGKVACVKKDGTDYKELAELASELGEIQELVIHKDYLYFEGYRVNLANNQVEEDEFKHGDKIDEDDFVYTASLSDGKTMTIAKYKVGTSFEGLEKIYSKDIQEGLNINTDKINIDIQEDRVYLSFSYYDNNTENWRPMDAGGETCSMKKDGSDLKQIN